DRAALPRRRRAARLRARLGGVGPPDQRAGAARPAGRRARRAVEGVSAIRIRGATRADARAVWEINSCPGVIRGTLQLPYQSLDEVEKRFAEAPPNTRRLVAEVDGRVVGILGLELGRGRRAHSAALGMSVH